MNYVLTVPDPAGASVAFVAEAILRANPSTYRCVAKEFTVESHFHEYLTYVSPAPGRTERFAAALNTEAVASPEELEAYRAIVGSLVLFAAEP